MAAPKIVFAVEATRDLDGLFDYIARDSGVDRAEAILRRIDETLVNLAYMPRMGRVRSDLEGGPRTISVWPWVIIYEPMSAEGAGVFIWRIVDGRRDLPSVVTPPAHDPN